MDVTQLMTEEEYFGLDLTVIGLIFTKSWAGTQPGQVTQNSQGDI